MSFFKDFKDDLSQAVNELLPEETTDASADSLADLESEAQMVDTITEDEPAFGKDDIADMLKNFEAMSESTEEKPAEVQVEQVKEQVAVPVPESEPIPAVAPVVSEPVVEKTPVAAPEPVVIPEPVVSEQIVVTPVAAQSEPEKVEEAPVIRRAVEPVFAPVNEQRAPINTVVREVKKMETGIIIDGMSVKGDIRSEGSLDVQGDVIGNIEIAGKLNITGSVEGNSKAEEVFADGAKIIGEIVSEGSVKIGQSSVVRGNITAKSAVLAGAVKGDIDVQGPVILDTTAIIMGNIKSKSIQINNGAVIEGLCSQCYADVSPISFFEDSDKTAKKAKS